MLKILLTRVLPTLLTVLFVTVYGPQLHSTFMRKYVGDKVVSIYGERSGGTGFHVQTKSGKTVIMTNNHICNLASSNEELTVVDRSGKKHIRKVLFRHKFHDLCMVEPLEKLSGLATAMSTYVGEIAGIIGHPGLRPLSLSRGEIIGSLNISLIVGENLSEDRCFGTNYTTEQIVAKLKLPPMLGMMLYAQGIYTICFAENLNSVMFNGISYGGNSGSPVVNVFGNVVGVLYAGGKHSTDAYLVPLPILQEFLNEH